MLGGIVFHCYMYVSSWLSSKIEPGTVLIVEGDAVEARMSFTLEELKAAEEGLWKLTILELTLTEARDTAILGNLDRISFAQPSGLAR